MEWEYGDVQDVSQARFALGDGLLFIQKDVMSKLLLRSFRFCGHCSCSPAVLHHPRLRGARGTPQLRSERADPVILSAIQDGSPGQDPA